MSLVRRLPGLLAIVCGFSTLFAATGILAVVAGCGGGNAGGGSNSSTITSVSASCSPSSILTNQTSTCTPAVSGTGSYSSAVTWTVSPASIGMVNGSGVFTPAGTGTATLTATSAEDTAKSGNTTVTVGNPLPTITSLSPSTLSSSPSPQTLAVYGTGFLSSSTVTFNGISHLAAFISASQITISLTPADLATVGSYPIVVTNPAPGGGSSAAATLTVVNPAPGWNLSLAPSLVYTGATTPATVTVTGTNFLPASTIQLNGATVATTYVSATQLTFQLSAAEAATAQLDTVSVMNPAPGGGASSGTQLEILAQTPAPVIASVSPTQFVIGAGATTMTVTGSNLIAENVAGMPIAGSPLLTSNLLWNGASLAVQNFSSVSGVDTVVVQIPESLVTAVGTVSITASSQTSTPALSNIATVSIVDPPAPTLTSVIANSGLVNTPVEVTLNGTGFQKSSTVSFNGEGGDAQYVNPTTINLQISASSIPTPGAYPITVTTPYGGTTAALDFTAYVLSVAADVNISSNSMVYNPVNGLFYLSVPSTAGLPYGNSIVSVDPMTGALGTPIPIGSEPDKLSLTEDGRYLWVSWYGGTNISKVDLVAGNVAYVFSTALGEYSIAHTSSVGAIPGEPDSVIVSNYLDYYSQQSYPAACSTSIYDGGVLRGSPNGNCSMWSITADPTLDKVFGYGPSPTNTGLFILAYNASGITYYEPGASDSTYTQIHACEMALAGGIVYTNGGSFFNANTNATQGFFPPPNTQYTNLGQGGSIAIDPGLGGAYILETPTSTTAQVDVYNLADQINIAAAPIPSTLIANPASDLGSGNCLSRWGTDGLAFRTDTGFVSLQTSLVKDLTSVNADLGVAISATGANSVGSTTAYTVTVTNNGPATATSVTLSASIPATGAVSSATPSAGSCSTNGAVTCELGSLNNGASAAVVIDILQNSADSAVMTAQVSASETDPVLTNNQAASTLTIASGSLNPVPVLTSVTPSLIAGGTSNTAITLFGSNFTSASTVLLDTTALTTTFVSSNQLEVTVTPAELAGTALAALFVVNPAPGGGLSSGLPLTVYTVLPMAGANHILYDPYSRKIMASVGLHSSTNPNSIVAITPETATISAAVPIGGSPTVLALTSDGQILYAMMPGNITGQIARYNMLTQQPDFTVSGFTATNADYQLGLQYIATMPGTEDTIGVDSGINGYDAIWDFNPVTQTAVMRKNTTTDLYRSGIMLFPNATSMFFGDLILFPIDSDGIDNVILNEPQFTYEMMGAAGSYKLSGNNLFTQLGYVINIENSPATLSGVFNELTQDAYIPGDYGDPYLDFEVDSSLGLSYYLNNSNSIYDDDSFDSVAIYDNQSYMPMNHLMIPFKTIEGSNSYAGIDVVRWGQDGLALLTDSGNLYLIRGAVIPQLLSPNMPASLTSSSMTAISHGAGNTLLTLTGANFAPGVAVTWNGSYRTTAIVDATHVTVAIPASDLASAGSASLVATNPGAAASGTVTVTIN